MDNLSKKIFSALDSTPALDLSVKSPSLSIEPIIGAYEAVLKFCLVSGDRMAMRILWKRAKAGFAIYAFGLGLKSNEGNNHSYAQILIPFYDQFPKAPAFAHPSLFQERTKEALELGFKYLNEAGEKDGIAGNAWKLHEAAAQVAIEFDFVQMIRAMVRRFKDENGNITQRGQFLVRVLDVLASMPDSPQYFSDEDLVEKPRDVMPYLNGEPFITLIRNHCKAGSSLIEKLADKPFRPIEWADDEGRYGLVLYHLVLSLRDYQVPKEDLNYLVTLRERVAAGVADIREIVWKWFFWWLYNVTNGLALEGLLPLAIHTTAFQTALIKFSQTHPVGPLVVHGLVYDPKAGLTEGEREIIQKQMPPLPKLNL